MTNYGRLFREKIYTLLQGMTIKVGDKTAPVILMKPERSNGKLPRVIVGDASLTSIQTHDYHSYLETFSLPIAVHAQGSRDSSSNLSESFQDVYNCKYELIKSLYNFSWIFAGTYGGECSIAIHDDEVEGSEIFSSFTISITVNTQKES